MMEEYGEFDDLEELTCPSGRKVKISFNTTTMRLVFNNPYLDQIEKMYRSYLEVKGWMDEHPGEEPPEEKGLPILEGLRTVMDYSEQVDRAVSILVKDPIFYLPEDENPPEGAVPIAKLRDLDKMAIFQQAMGYLGSFRDLLPFRSGG